MEGCGKLSWFCVVLKNILILYFGFVVLNFEKDFKKVLLFKVYFEYFLKRKIEKFYFKIYDLVKKILILILFLEDFKIFSRKIFGFWFKILKMILF